MGMWEGLLGGFEGRRREVETINREAAEKASARESAVFQALLSSPDPEIQALAVTGMLESTQPKAKKRGFAGFLGQFDQSPTYQKIIELAKTPVDTPTPVMGPPSRSVTTQTMQPPPSLQPAAQSPTAITQVGAPPPPTLSWRQNPSVQTGTAMIPKPRQLFQTPEQMALAQSRAKAQGDVEGDVAGLVAAGFSPEEARQLVKAERERRMSGTTPFQAVSGEVPDGQGGWRQVYGVFDRISGKFLDSNTRQPLEGFRQRTNTAAQRFGVDREALARAKYGKDFKDLNQQEADLIIGAEQELIKREAGQRVAGAGEAKMAVPADLDTARQNQVPVGTRASDVQGQIVATQPVIAQRRSVENVRDQLAYILGTPDKPGPISVLPKKTDLIGGIAPGAVMAVKRRSRNDREAVAQLDSALQNIVNVMARSVAEQRGAQTEADAVRAEAAIVQMRDAILSGDTQESATARINESLRLLEQILGRLPSAPVTTPGIVPGPGGPPAPQQAAPVQMKKDANGNWVIAY